MGARIRMRFGINLLYLIPGEVGGTETYVRNLLNALEKIDKENEYILFTNRENHDTFTFESLNFRKQLCNISSKNKFVRVLWEQLLFPFKGDLRAVDVLFSPGYVVPVLSRKKHIVAIHDMLYKRYPGLVSTGKLFFWSLFVPLSVHRSRYVLTFSEHSRSDIVNLLNAKPERVVVTYGAINNHFTGAITPEQDAMIKAKYGINGPFVLTVATLSPHKNLSNLLRAFDVVRRALHQNVQLFLAGKNERSTQELIGIIRELDLQQHVRLLGHVPTEDLTHLYRLADCFVLPSIMEGFGYPVLEAMQLGCPVVCSNSASLPEVAGGAALFFDPLSPEEIASTLEMMLKDAELRKEYRRKGRENVHRFSWEETARQTVRVFLSATN